MSLTVDQIAEALRFHQDIAVNRQAAERGKLAERLSHPRPYDVSSEMRAVIYADGLARPWRTVAEYEKADNGMTYIDAVTAVYEESLRALTDYSLAGSSQHIAYEVILADHEGRRRYVQDVRAYMKVLADAA